MAEALLVKSGGGTDSSDLTATLSQVLSGYTAMTSDSNDDPGTGTMPNRGAVNQTLNAGGSYTIPHGYHNGNGKVAANSLASQTSGNASSAQILIGYNAWANGSNINGSMPNRGKLDFNPSSSTSQSVPAGYYSGGTLNSANAYNAGKEYSAVQIRDVYATQENFGDYGSYGLSRSVQFSPPSISGYSIIGAYIKTISITNSNSAFSSATFEILQSGGNYYIISNNATWSAGNTSVSATMTFILQRP